MSNKCIIVGTFGSFVAAICCFTPVLVIALSAVGLSGWLGWLDYVLLPALVLFILILGIGLWQKKSN